MSRRSTMRGTAAAASGVLTVMRTSSEPARQSSATCFAVAAASAVSVLVIDCTTTGASPPTATPPTHTWRVGRRGAGPKAHSDRGATTVACGSARDVICLLYEPRAPATAPPPCGRLNAPGLPRWPPGRYGGPPSRPRSMAQDPPREVLTPSQLNVLARDLLEGAFPLVWVKGELGNLSRPSSGHLYFTLKDARAQIRCALFKPKSQWLKFVPREGLRVLGRGRLTLYEARGDYQLVFDHLEEAGEGALRRAFEELKAKLAAEGLFASERKRPLPAHVRRLGVVTSPSGAAVRD